MPGDLRLCQTVSPARGPHCSVWGTHVGARSKIGGNVIILDNFRQ